MPVEPHGMTLKVGGRYASEMRYPRITWTDARKLVVKGVPPDELVGFWFNRYDKRLYRAGIGVWPGAEVEWHRVWKAGLGTLAFFSATVDSWYWREFPSRRTGVGQAGDDAFLEGMFDLLVSVVDAPLLVAVEESQQQRACPVALAMKSLQQGLSPLEALVFHVLTKSSAIIVSSKFATKMSKF